MGFISDIIIKYKKCIVFLFTIALLIFGYCALQLNINYDMTDYLPEDANSTKAIEIMSEEFGGALTNAYVLVKNVDVDEAIKYKQKIKDVDGVEIVSWIDESMGIDMLKAVTSGDFSNLKIENAGVLGGEDALASAKETIEQYYKDGNALFYVTIKDGKERKAVDEIYDIVGDNGGITGTAVDQASSQSMALNETIKSICVLGPLVIIVLLLATTSWIEPFIFLITIGMAIIINLGLCIFNGEISYVTLAVGPILQLAVSIDYAVFLCHSFEKNRKDGLTPDKAMKKSMKESFKSISASALTTLFGFAALLFMKFKLGIDMGVPLVIGVIMSFVCVMLFLPAFLLLTHKWVEKTKHKSFIPNFKRLGGWLIKPRWLVILVALILVVPAYNAQKDNDFTYGTGEPSSESRIAKDTKNQNEIFGEQNMMVIMVPKGKVEQEDKLANELTKNKHILKIVDYTTSIGKDIPINALPEETVKQFYGDNYARIIVYTDLDTEGKEAFDTLEEIRESVTKYYDDEWYMCGATPNMYDMKITVTEDQKLVDLITIIAIFMILLVEFKSIIIPLILIAVIKFAFWVTLSIPYLMNNPICYIGYIVVSAVMMGATIDYAILFTDNYLTNRHTMTKLDAMKETLNKNIKSVLVSALILAIAGFSLAFISTESVVQVLGSLLGEGAVIAFVLSLILLSALLIMFDKLIPKLSIGLKFHNGKTSINAEEKNKSVNTGNRIICINRQFGSGGHEIGKIVADKLGIPFYDEEIIDKVIKQSGLNKELIKCLDEKKPNDYLYTALYEGKDKTIYGKSLNEVIYELEKKTIIELASNSDCVIIGRCAGDILKENTNSRVIQVFISAPLEFRINRKLALNDNDKKKTSIIVEKMDTNRKKYHEHFTKKKWNDPINYDMTLNTESLGIENAVNLLGSIFNNIDKK